MLSFSGGTDWRWCNAKELFGVFHTRVVLDGFCSGIRLVSGYSFISTIEIGRLDKKYPKTERRFRNKILALMLSLKRNFCCRISKKFR